MFNQLHRPSTQVGGRSLWTPGRFLIFPMISTDNLLMAEIPAWVSALKIKDEDYLEWIAIFPSAEFILSWAIESKRVDETAYIKWATAHYKLPVVKPDFFKKNKPPLEMWKKFVYGPWSPTVLPLYEYKETLFVGVLEPKNFSLAPGIKVQLVLSPSTLQNPWWHLYSQLRKETVPAAPPVPVVEEPAKPIEAPKPKVTPPPPPPKSEETATYSSLPLTVDEITQTNTGRGVFVIDEISRPATPLGLEDNEIVPEEHSEFKIEINSPNPAACDEPEPPKSPSLESTTPPAELGENTGKFAKVSAKPLEGAPESVAHALEILKAARAASTKPPPVIMPEAPIVTEPAAPIVTQPVAPVNTPIAIQPVTPEALKPIEAPMPEPDTLKPPPLPKPAPLPRDAVVEIVTKPVPVEEVTVAAPIEIPLETPPTQETVVAAIDPPGAALPVTEQPVVVPPPEIPPPPAFTPPPPPPPVAVAPPPPPPEVVQVTAQLASELLKPEKKIDLSTHEEPSKVTRIRTGASRKDTSIGFDELIAPVVKDNITPDGITFDLNSIPPPPPPPEKFETDALPDGLGGGIELIDKSPRSITPEGLGAIEIPSVEIGNLENLITDDREIELPELNFEKQQTLMEDLNTAVRKASLSPTHQGSTPAANAPAAAPQAPAAPGAAPVKPTVTGPSGQSVEEIVFTGVPEGSIKLVLEKLKTVFERGMVLLRQEGRLRPYQWDPSWPLDVAEKGDVELALNSLFKIVVESKYPFHGSARPAMPNDRFFKKWNKNQYPPWVTALPLKAHDEVFGILLAVASAERAPTIILQDWEKVAAELSADLAKQIGAAA